MKQPPRNGLVRVRSGGVEFVDRDGDGTRGPRLTGHFAVFNEWTEIDSMLEGRFMERVMPGAFRTQFKQPGRMRVLFQHGRDPEVADKPIATPEPSAGGITREDQNGAFYDVPLFRGFIDEHPLVVDGLIAGQYGASFRFRVLRDRFEDNPGEAEHNPNGLPERSIIEAQVPEFGPVTFPAYWGATAGMRSMTDEFVVGGLAQADPELVRMAADGMDLAEVFREQQEDIADTFRKRKRHKPREKQEAREERADVSDMMVLTGMINCGAQYIAMQDDPDEAPLKVRMQGILHQLTDLLNGEIDEDEPTDDMGSLGDVGMYSSDADGEEREVETPGRRVETEPAPVPDPEQDPEPDDEPSPVEEPNTEPDPVPVGANGGRSKYAAQGLSPTPLYRPALSRKRREPWAI